MLITKNRLLGIEPPKTLKIPKDKLASLINRAGSWKKTAESLKVSESTLRKYGIDIGLTLDHFPRGRKMDYSMDDDYFSEINTEEKAYWLGFLSGDGCVSGNRVVLGLAKIDRNHVEKFQTAILCTKNVEDTIQSLKINNKEYYCSVLGFTSKNMANDLKNHGVVEAKSLIIKPSKNVPEELMPHYIRGIFDADGAVYATERDRTDAIEWTLSFSGSYDIVDKIAEWIGSKLGSEKKNPRPNGSIYILTYSGCRLPQTVIKLFYDNPSVYLDRKYEKVQEMLAQQPLRQNWDQLTESSLLEMKKIFKTWAAVSVHLGIKDDKILDQIRTRIGGAVAPQPHADHSNITKEMVIEAIANSKNKQTAANSLNLSDSMFYKFVKQFGLIGVKLKPKKN